MTNYEVVPLRGQEQFDLNGVRFNGKRFLFWKKKSTDRVKQIIVIFDRKYENVQVHDGVMVVSFNGLTNYRDLRDAIMVFLQIVQESKSVQFQFVVDNENQRQVADALGKEFGILYEVHLVNKKKKDNIDNVEQKLQDNQALTASGSKMIDTGSKKITVNDNKAYVNQGLLSIEEQKYLLLEEWKKDAVMMRKLADLSEAEIDRMLIDSVTHNLTTHHLESAREQSANDRVGEVAMNKAIQEDGLVNANLGIVQNNVSNSNQYSSVSKQGDRLQVVNPNVVSSEIHSGGVTGSVSGDGNYQEYQDSSLTEKTEQSRESLAEFYLDEEYYIYNNQGVVIGKIGQDGYNINYNDNTLVRNGHTVGFIGDYKDMGKSTSKSNVRKKVLEKNNDSNKSPAFVRLPVIMFILSFLLLIGSLVLLFVLD